MWKFCLIQIPFSWRDDLELLLNSNVIFSLISICLISSTSRRAIHVITTQTHRAVEQLKFEPSKRIFCRGYVPSSLHVVSRTETSSAPTRVIDEKMIELGLWNGSGRLCLGSVGRRGLLFAGGSHLLTASFGFSFSFWCTLRPSAMW